MSTRTNAAARRRAATRQARRRAVWAHESYGSLPMPTLIDLLVAQQVPTNARTLYDRLYAPVVGPVTIGEDDQGLSFTWNPRAAPDDSWMTMESIRQDGRTTSRRRWWTRAWWQVRAWVPL